jgi:hypothetical protein
MTIPPESIILRFSDHVRIPGSELVGCVDLNVALARQEGIDHVRLEVHGTVRTYAR